MKIFRKNKLGLIFTLPAVGIVLFIMLYPISRGIILSFFEYNIFSAHGVHFVSIDNYLRLTRDSRFIHSLILNLYWTGGSVLLSFFIGFLIAILLNQKFKGRALIRGIVIIPWVVPTAVTATMWVTLLQSTGLINRFLIKLGIINSYFPWLGNEYTVMPMLIIVHSWREVPYFVLMLLAGLDSIPTTLYEAAEVDGAGIWGKFRGITLPFLKPIIAVSLLLQAIWTFKLIDYVAIMTKGGPFRKTEILPYYSYITVFVKGYGGYAATISTVSLLIMSVFILIYYWVRGGSFLEE